MSAYLGMKIRTRSLHLLPADSCWAVTFISIPRDQHVGGRSTAASAALYNRGVSVVSSACGAIPLHMPRTDRQSILLLAYRNSLGCGRHLRICSCQNHSSHQYQSLIELVLAPTSDCRVVWLKPRSRLSMASRPSSV